MANNIDREVLQGFVEEALGYLPRILDGIDCFHHDPTQDESLEETHRLTHSIKGAAGMLGLPGLANIAMLLEEALEQVASGQLAPDPDTFEVLTDTAAGIGRYLDQLVSGSLVERPLIERTVTAFRRLRGLPEAGDAAEVERLSPPGEPPSFAGAPEPPAPRPAPTPAEPPTAFVDPVPAPSAPADEPEVTGASPELLEAFAEEASDHLAVVGAGLRRLEDDPTDSDALGEVRRTVHTLKGAAAMVGRRRCADLAHRMEDLLEAVLEQDAASDQTVELDFEPLQLLFSTADALEDLAVSGEVSEGTSLEGLYQRYDDLLGSPRSASEPSEQSPPAQSPPEQPPSTTAAAGDLGGPASFDFSEIGADLLAAEAARTEAGAADSLAGQTERGPVERGPVERGPAERGPVVRVPIARLDEVVRLVSELVVSGSTFERYFQQLRREVGELGLSSQRLRQLSHRFESEYEAFALTSQPRLEMAGAPAAGWSGSSFSDFDELELDRYTELHRVSRQLSESTNDLRTLEGGLGQRLGDFEGYLTRVSRLTGEIQDKLMRLRMVPIAQLSSRLHRAVRVTARDQEKQVSLVLEGEDTALDKTVLEEIGDPLLHLLRNAVDHGIEPPSLRRVLGKPERGQIRFRALHQGTQVVLEIHDDGAGLDVDKLRARAVETGRLSEAEAAQAEPESLYPLIFEPGFTTSAEVSEISGRGVGLDAVRSVVHRLEGSLSVRSEPGHGVQFTIRLPLTLAVIRAILVESGEQTFALPLAPVRQILRLESGDLEALGEERLVRVRDETYPAVALHDALALADSGASATGRFPALILDLGERKVALLVDRIVEARDVVVKNLGSLVRRTPAVTGATLMGDGSVVLILDPQELAGLDSPVLGQLPPPSLAAAAPAAAVQRPLEILVVDDSVSVRRVLSNLLRNQGWNPVAARDGVEALEVLQGLEHQPDAILLDIEMPRMDGYELTTTLRGRSAYRDVPIVMLTSRAGEKHRQRAFEAGATEYLVKPYQDEILLQMLRRLTRGNTPPGPSTDPASGR